MKAKLFALLFVLALFAAACTLEGNSGDVSGNDAPASEISGVRLETQRRNRGKLDYIYTVYKTDGDSVKYLGKTTKHGGPYNSGEDRVIEIKDGPHHVTDGVLYVNVDSLK